MSYLKEIEGTRGSMTFNGKATTEFNLVVQTVPSYTFAEKEVETTHIPGKNGDTIYETGAYLNTSRSYNLAGLFTEQTTLENHYENFVKSCSSIVSWLSNTTGYRELTDSYESDYYRLAKFIEAGEVINVRDQALMMEVTFNCKPQRYLIAGKDETDITEIFENPTNYTAKPLIIVKGYTLKTGAQTLCECEVVEKSETISIVLNIADKTGLPESAVDVYIDSETENVYAIDSNNVAYSLNFAIDLNFEFINMEPNLSYEFTSDHTVKVKPRWWTL